MLNWIVGQASLPVGDARCARPIRPTGQDLVPGIVGGTAQYRRQIHCREATADPDDAAVRVIAISQIAEIGRRAGTTAVDIVAIRDRGHPRIIIVRVAGKHVVGQLHAGGPIGRIVSGKGCAQAPGSLLDIGQPVGIVKRIVRLRLSGGSHRAWDNLVVLVVDRALGRLLRNDVVQHRCR